MIKCRTIYCFRILSYYSPDLSSEAREEERRAKAYRPRSVGRGERGGAPRQGLQGEVKGRSSGHAFLADEASEASEEESVPSSTPTSSSKKDQDGRDERGLQHGRQERRGVPRQDLQGDEREQDERAGGLRVIN